MQTSATHTMSDLPDLGEDEVAPRKDRRKAKRFRMDLGARFRMVVPSDPSVASGFFSAQTYDLSESGIGLLTGTIWCDGFHVLNPWPATLEQCVMEIQILADGGTFTVEGRAVYYLAEWAQEPFAFRVGVEFLDMTAEQMASLQKIISRHGREDEPFSM